jgi:hypothetical protein
MVVLSAGDGECRLKPVVIQSLASQLLQNGDSL